MGGDAISTTKPLPVECICPKQNFPKLQNERLDTHCEEILILLGGGRGTGVLPGLILFIEVSDNIYLNIMTALVT